MQTILALVSFCFVSLLLREWTVIVVCIVIILCTCTKYTMLLAFLLYPGHPTVSVASFCLVNWKRQLQCTRDVNIGNIHLNGKCCFFLPGGLVVILKRSCVSFFWVGAKWSFFTKAFTCLWSKVSAAASDADAWVMSANTLSKVLGSSTFWTSLVIVVASCCTVFFLAFMASLCYNIHVVVNSLYLHTWRFHM